MTGPKAFAAATSPGAPCRAASAVMSIRIAPSNPEEHAALLALYPQAFPDEDLTGLVQALLRTTDVLSLTAWRDNVVSGHALFTRCSVYGAVGTVALLGPLCIAPDAQRQGLGRTLIDEGAQRLAAEGVSALLVLGDPDYYSRVGFSVPSPVAAPYELPSEWTEAWRIRPLTSAAPVTGQLSVPAPWRDPQLWR